VKLSFGSQIRDIVFNSSSTHNINTPLTAINASVLKSLLMQRRYMCVQRVSASVGCLHAELNLNMRYCMQHIA
jgi:hypothetical protein